ncbi:MAG: hypothetical protein CXT77_01665 [uncultured DHVE6 group euryarchaeote]|jgi:predicted metalloendopeptidase|nr:MAG: hypothetical protein CXT77_01665 [uncultured DHVE6 group euryarchaeote]
MSKTYSPKESFFHYVNHDWLNNTKIPDDEASWGVHNMLRKNTQKMLINDMKTIKDKKLSLWWAQSNDMKKRNQLDLEPIKLLLNLIDKIQTREDLWKVVAQLHKNGTGPFFMVDAESDYNNPNINIAHFDQGGLGLPNRDYYLDKDKEKIRKKYLIFLERIFQYSKDLFPGTSPKIQAKEVLEFETELAKKHLDKELRRDPEKVYNPIIAKKLTNWKTYFESIKINITEKINIEHPPYFSFLEKIKVNSEVISYLRLHTILSFTSCASQKIYDITFDFYAKELSGTKKQKSLEERNIILTGGYLGELLGKEYVSKHFSHKNKKEIEKLVVELKKSLHKILTELEWMSPKTKKEAFKKLKNMGVKIGYTDKWRNYSKLKLEDDNLINNAIRINKFEWEKMRRKFNKKIDKTTWWMHPYEINAYYHQLRNEIVFPAGILQYPFYKPGNDAINYGAIGSVIGHEITHGFDDKGRKFDSEGKLRDWWTIEDAKKYNSEAEKIIKQYSDFKLYRKNINGKFTQGENIADVGGIKMSYYAFLNSGKRNIADKKNFFKAYAVSWKSKSTKELMIRQIATDPHSPAVFRVDGVVSNLTEFYDLYDISPEDKQFNKDRVNIW